MIVGLTGGIGSGKTTIAGFFKELGIAVYIADNAAKNIMVQSPEVKEEIIKLLGEEAYVDDVLNRPYIANRVFSKKATLKALNAIVHPAVQKDFEAWATTQKSPYVIKEAAVLYENGGYKKCDYTILVTAPLDRRITRVMQRDNTTQESVERRIAAQWSDFRKMAFADAVMDNIRLEDTKDHVQKLHIHLLRRIQQKW